jgi:hypothetical protein
LEELEEFEIFDKLMVKFCLDCESTRVSMETVMGSCRFSGAAAIRKFFYLQNLARISA